MFRRAASPNGGYGAFYPGGAVQGKAADASMAKDMIFVARMGHPCGQEFQAKPISRCPSGI